MSNDSNLLIMAPGGTSTASPNAEKLDEIFECIRENDEKRLHDILEQDQNIADLLTTERDGTTALHKSVGQVQCVKLMLSHGAEANIPTQDGIRPIHVAAERDFVESLMLLVIYGADFNEKTANNKTPLHIAVENQARACRDFLHFLGAQIEDESILNENKYKEFKMKLRTIQQGYRDKKVFCGGKDVPVSPHAKVEIEDCNDSKAVTIGIEGNTEPFRLYVRRMLVDYEYCSVRVPEVKRTHEIDLLSDIYQYWVDKTVKCDIYVPLVGKFKTEKYKTLILKQATSFDDSGEVITDTVNVVDGKAFAKGVTLFANGSSHFVALGIFAINKVDEKKVDPSGDTKVKSSVLDPFEAIVPAGTAPLDTRIKLQVLKVESTEQSSSDSGVDSNTDFCSVNLSSDDGDATSIANTTTQNKLTVFLPRPRSENGSNLIVMTCTQGSSGLDADSWKAVSGENLVINQLRVMCKDVKSGLYMVLSVCKKYGRWLMEKVKDLLEFAIGAKVKCKLFAVLKQTATNFLVHVVLCCADKYVDELRDCLVKGYQEQESGPTDEFEIDSKCLLMLHLEMTGAQVEFQDLPVQYQGGVSKSQTFTVCPEQNKQAYGVIFSFKRTVPKKENYGRKCKTTLPITFEKCKSKSISEGVFLSDRTIIEMAENAIGDKWFVLGIYLGFSGEYLISMDNIEPQTRNQMVLYKWRDNSYPSTKEKLDKLVSACVQAELPKLMTALVSEVERHMDNRESDMQTWLKHFKSEEGKRERYSPIIVSPLSDPFLVLVAKQLLVDDRFFIELDLPQSECYGCRRIGNETQRKFKMLMLVRDIREDTMKFLQDLVRTLVEFEQQLPIRILTEQVRSWLNTEEGKKFPYKDTLKKTFKLAK